MRGNELIVLLEKAGWTLDRIRGSHHIMIKGKLTLSVPVHGKKDLPKGLLNRLMKDGGLNDSVSGKGKIFKK
jgi:predicted RNA binding protein YcfA (HicA-like mRNA interferase family)